MFSSNQIFSVSGSLKDTDSIVKVFELLESFGISYDSYAYLDTGDLCFYRYGTDRENSVSIVKEDRYPNYYNAVVSLYLASSRYKNAMANTWNPNGGADGSSREGWRISVGNENFSKFLIVSPYWCFYHK